ncbi:MAG: hypothetical protein LBE75_07320 [Burkholderiales bacterium]|jgi:hypothetical protein|nr:hypothetical protein [Burkholderiales bacterium]
MYTLVLLGDAAPSLNAFMLIFLHLMLLQISISVASLIRTHRSGEGYDLSIGVIAVWCVKPLILGWINAEWGFIGLNYLGEALLFALFLFWIFLFSKSNIWFGCEKKYITKKVVIIPQTALFLCLNLYYFLAR